MKTFIRVQLLITAIIISSFSYSQLIVPGANIVSPGNNSCNAAQGSYESWNFGRFALPVPPGLTLNELNWLSTDYLEPAGTQVLNVASFEVLVVDECFDVIFLQFNVHKSHSPSWVSSGNVATDNDPVYLYGGCNNDYYGAVIPYSTIKPLFGHLQVVEISMVSFVSSNLQMTFDNTNVNGTVYTYDDCDNDGIPDDVDCDSDNNKNGKWQVCHNGQTICISESALSSHLAHGDVMGECVTSNASRPATVEVQPAIAKNFSISSYPNPMSQVAKIHYTVPTAAKVSIRIYDVTGREVAQLFNGERTAGNYTMDYNTSALGKGIYYCRMIATSAEKAFVQTHKMVKVE